MSWLVGIFCQGAFLCSSDTVVPHSTSVTESMYEILEPELSSDFGRSMRSFTLRRYNLQLEEDSRNAEFFPKIYGEDFLWTEPTPLGTVQLGHTLYRGEFSVVFAARIDSGEYIIKYRSDCDKTRKVHPLLVDSWYASKAANLGVAISPVFVSPGTSLEGSNSHKIGFGMTEEEMRRCTRIGGRVRYGLWNRLEGGVSAADLDVRAGTVEFREAIVIFRELILSLEKIHTAGFVHGDIRSRHVLVTRNPITVRLIDFSAAQFVPTLRAHDPVQPMGYRGDPEMSPWEIRGYTYGPRDDVYRAVRMLAVLLNKKSVYSEHETKVTKRGITAILDWKLKSNIFIVPGSDYDPVLPGSGMNSALLNFIHSQLTAISTAAQGMEFQQPVGVVNYDYFVERANAILVAIDHSHDASREFPSDVRGSGEDESI